MSPPPVYCRDYDEPNAKPTNPYINLPNDAGSAKIGIDSLHYVSPQHEITFFTSAGPSDPNEGRTAAEFIGEPAIVHKAHFGFSVYLDAAADTGTSLLLAAIGFGGTGAPDYNVAVRLGGGKAPYIGEEYGGQQMYSTNLVKVPAIGAWSRVDIVLDFDTTKGVVTVDGVDTTMTMHMPQKGDVSLTIGVAYYNNGQSVIATTARFDNVVYYGN
jgi:hypothetical protein